MKNLVYVSLCSVAVLFSAEIYSMRQELPPVQVMFSNQTDGEITIVTRGGEVVTMESCSDVALSIQPDYAVTADQAKVTTILTAQGEFKLDYNGSWNIFFLTRENKVIGEFKGMKNPIIIIENDGSITLKERFPEENLEEKRSVSKLRFQHKF